MSHRANPVQFFLQSRLVDLKFRQMRHQLVRADQPEELVADHFVGPQRRLAARPQANQQAGDDRAIGLNLEALLAVAQQMPTAEHVLEEAKESFGGYQVIKKWLSYREEKLLGRALQPEEVREVTSTARRLSAIILLQPKLDDNYRAVKDASFDWSSVVGG